MFLTADFLWRMFETTGSVRAYMLYKKLVVH
nr:YqzL family protein [Desulforadius tongensis]